MERSAGGKTLGPGGAGQQRQTQWRMRKGGDAGAGGRLTAVAGAAVGTGKATGPMGRAASVGRSVRSTIPAGRSQHAHFRAGSRGGSLGAGFSQQSEHFRQAGDSDRGGVSQQTPPLAAQHQSGGRASSAAQRTAGIAERVAISVERTWRGRPRSTGNRAGGRDSSAESAYAGNLRVRQKLPGQRISRQSQRRDGLAGARMIVDGGQGPIDRVKGQSLQSPGPIPSRWRVLIVRAVLVVLVVLAVLPMFMPPGMCLCQFASAAAPVSGSEQFTTSAVAEPTIAPVNDACCKRCGRHLDPEPAAPADSEPPSTPLPRPADPPKPAPPAQDHRPDCPVVTGLSLWTAVLADSLGGEWFQPVGMSVEAIRAEATDSHRPDRGPPTAPSAPLFISHCTLLI